MMYEKWKAWLKIHSGLCLLALLLVALAFFVLGSGKDIPGDGNANLPIGRELESAAADSAGIQERIGDAEKSADIIEESAWRSGQLADEAESITRDCKQIIETIRRRTEESETEAET